MHPRPAHFTQELGIDVDIDAVRAAPNRGQPSYTVEDMVLVWSAHLFVVMVSIYLKVGVIGILRFQPDPTQNMLHVSALCMRFYRLPLKRHDDPSACIILLFIGAN
jgi:hypothetical protein